MSKFHSSFMLATTTTNVDRCVKLHAIDLLNLLIYPDTGLGGSLLFLFFFCIHLLDLLQLLLLLLMLVVLISEARCLHCCRCLLMFLEAHG